MDLEGVAVSNGSACTSGSMQPSHVLLAMGFPENQAKCAVRFSMSRFTSIEDVNICVEALKKVLKFKEIIDLISSWFRFINRKRYSEKTPLFYTHLLGHIINTIFMIQEQ